MSDLPDDTIKKRLHEIFPDPLTASRVVDIVTRKTPAHYSRRSHLPYYNEYMAKLTKKQIDIMIAEKCPLVWYYSAWPDYTPRTLYVRVNQSINFILDHMDPEGIYRKWSSVKRIRQIEDVGVRIEFLPGFDGTAEQSFAATKAISSEETPVWRRDMENWLEGDDVKPFVKERLTLTTEEVRALKSSLSQMMGIEISINNTSVKIIRTN